MVLWGGTKFSLNFPLLIWVISARAKWIMGEIDFDERNRRRRNAKEPSCRTAQRTLTAPPPPPPWRSLAVLPISCVMDKEDSGRSEEWRLTAHSVPVGFVYFTFSLWFPPSLRCTAMAGGRGCGGAWLTCCWQTMEGTCYSTLVSIEKWRILYRMF